MHSMFCVFGLLFVSLGCASAARSTGCNLKLNAEIEKNFPLILTNASGALEFKIPKHGIVHLAKDEDIVFACSDSKNNFTFTRRNVITATCIEDNTLETGNTHLNFEELQCRKTIRGDVVETRESCGSGRGHIFKIGYQVSQRQWITLFEVCYDKQEGSALYAMHILHGEEIKYASKSSYRPSFSPQALPRSIPAAVAYKTSYQKSVLNKLLGSARLAERYINNKSFLSRGHLAPDADFLFAPWQYSTYYYINTSPQWQAINGGNWVRIENAIRNFAAKAKKPLAIITGTHDILELPDSNNNLEKIYLTTKKKIPVPKYTWKIVYDRETKEAIVLVVLNNPFTEGASEDDYLCRSVCENSGWKEDYFDNYEQGFVHCCRYGDFKDVVETVPYLNVRNLLENK